MVSVVLSLGTCLNGGTGFIDSGSLNKCGFRFFRDLCHVQLSVTAAFFVLASEEGSWKEDKDWEEKDLKKRAEEHQDA